MVLVDGNEKGVRDVAETIKKRLGDVVFLSSRHEIEELWKGISDGVPDVLGNNVGTY
ncbi:MAG: hypothetical protein QXS50_04005 [Candidatus Caldarchaeum sp.]